MPTENYLCATYNCTVTSKFCNDRRKKHDLYCTPCNPKDVMTRKIQKLINRQKDNKPTYFRRVVTMLFPIAVGQTITVKISSRGIKRQQSTISNVGTELGRKYRTVDMKNGTVFITRVQ